LGAGRLDEAAGAAARRARLRPHELAEDAARDVLNAADSGAGGTRGDRGIRLGAFSGAARTRDGDLEGDVAGRSVRRFDELDVDGRGEVGAARRAPEQVVAEERREEIGEAAEVEVPRLVAPAA